MIQHKILCAALVVIGTYILSMQIFEQSFRKQINFDYEELPWYLRFFLGMFGYKNKFKSGTIWMPEPAPSSKHFSLKQKWQIAAPFVGFILIVLGTIGSVFV